MNVALRQLRRARFQNVRCLATAMNHPGATTLENTGSAAKVSHRKPSTIPISNIEAQWAILDADEQQLVREQLNEIQKKSWKEMSLDEKKAAYWVAFGPHGIRTPVSKPGDNFRIFLGTAGVIAASVAAFFVIRQYAQPPPRTMTKEWQEASNELGRQQRLNPITGISSQDYKGKGFVSVDK